MAHFSKETEEKKRPKKPQQPVGVGERRFHTARLMKMGLMTGAGVLIPKD